MVVDYKVWDWQERYRIRDTGEIEIPDGKTDMREYLRPDTLFRQSKFPKYAEQAIRKNLEKKAKSVHLAQFKSDGASNSVANDKAEEAAWQDISLKIKALKAKFGQKWVMHYDEKNEEVLCHTS